MLGVKDIVAKHSAKKCGRQKASFDPKYASVNELCMIGLEVEICVTLYILC